MDPKVVSIANRVAEIVYSWPAPELQSQGGSFKSRTIVAQGLQHQGFQPTAAGGKTGKSLLSVCSGLPACQAEVYSIYVRIQLRALQLRNLC